MIRSQLDFSACRYCFVVALEMLVSIHNIVSHEDTDMEMFKSAFLENDWATRSESS